MKTKTLLIAAVVLELGIATSMAQVYSQQVVGYVNLILTNGYTAIANQLDLDGTGTNNTIYTSIGTNLPANTKVYVFDPVLGAYRNISLSASHVWSAGVAGNYVKTNLQPGGGVLVYVPGSGSVTNVTLVGNVLQTTNLSFIYTNIILLPSQFNLISFPFPVDGYLTTNFGYPPNPKNGGFYDTVLQWNVPSQTWVTHKFSGTSWTGGSPYIKVGESFFLIPNRLTVWPVIFPDP